jgi:hypothetical protein
MLHILYMRELSDVEYVCVVVHTLSCTHTNPLHLYPPQWWASESFGDQRDPKYIIIFAALVVACIIVGFYRALVGVRIT